MGDVSDPTDFASPSLPPSVPTTISEPLRSVDAVLRCHVCKDFFTNPVITSCYHTFCSLCVRRCLSVDGQCPYCRTKEQENKLRPNWIVEEMVERWTGGRQGLIDGLKTLSTRASTSPSTGASVNNHTRQTKRRKLNRDTENTSDVPSGRTTRATTRRAVRSSQEEVSDDLPPSQEVDMVEDSEGGSSYEDEGFSNLQTARKTSTRNSRPPPPPPEDGLVPCPVCGVRMKEEAVYTHLDSCTNPPPPPNRPSSHPKSNSPFIAPSSKTLNSSEPLKPLPTINYTLYNETKFRRKLKELGIPDWGPKLLLQRRHTEWLNLWNANCDSRRPKSKRELLHELDIWERTLGGHAAPAAGAQNASNMFASAAASGGGRENGGIAEKDFNTSQWNRAHQDDFKELIRKAREKRGNVNPPTPPPPPPPPPTSSAIPSSSALPTVIDPSSLPPTHHSETTKSTTATTNGHPPPPPSPPRLERPDVLVIDESPSKFMYSSTPRSHGGSVGDDSGV